MSDTWNPAGTALIQTDDGKREVPDVHDRFEDPTRKLMRVAKSEIDEKHKEPRS